jgi:hypothetical protein
VSTDTQADHGISLNVQQAKFTVYAQLSVLELVEVLVEAGGSATTLTRPGFQGALGLLRQRYMWGLCKPGASRHDYGGSS